MYNCNLGCTITGMPCYDPNANVLDAEECFSCLELRSPRDRSLSDTIVYCSDSDAENYNVFLMLQMFYGQIVRLIQRIIQVPLIVIMINLVMIFLF